MSINFLCDKHNHRVSARVAVSKIFISGLFITFSHLFCFC